MSAAAAARRKKPGHPNRGTTDLQEAAVAARMSRTHAKEIIMYAATAEATATAVAGAATAALEATGDNRARAATEAARAAADIVDRMGHADVAVTHTAAEARRANKAAARAAAAAATNREAEADAHSDARHAGEMEDAA